MSKLFLLLPGFLLLLSCTEENLTEKESESICTDTLTYSPARKKNHSVLYAANDLILTTDSLKIQHDLDSIFRGAHPDEFYDYCIDIITDSTLKKIKITSDELEYLYDENREDTLVLNRRKENLDQIIKYGRGLKLKQLIALDTVQYTSVLHNEEDIPGDSFWSIKEKSDFHAIRLCFSVNAQGVSIYTSSAENLTLSYYLKSIGILGCGFKADERPSFSMAFCPVDKKKTGESFVLYKHPDKWRKEKVMRK